jgi:crossover junction endodeoxyribonuclease RuvC
MKVLGADCGIHGACAVIEINDGTVPQLIDVIDIPTVGIGAKERVDVLALRSWIETHRPQHALIERGQAMPKQGASSGYKYGRAVGSIEATIACCGIPHTVIEPTAWKKFHGLAAARRKPAVNAHFSCFRAATRCSRASGITIAPRRR